MKGVLILLEHFEGICIRITILEFCLTDFVSVLFGEKLAWTLEMFCFKIPKTLARVWWNPFLIFEVLVAKSGARQ